MSTATPSQVGLGFNHWTDISLEPDTDATRHADLIPRSMQPDVDHHHHAPQSSSTFTTTSYSNLNINIPFDPPTSLSMSFTHKDDISDYHTRASSSATLRQGDINTGTDTARVCIHSMDGIEDNIIKLLSPGSSPQSDHSILPAPKIFHETHPRAPIGHHPRGVEPSTKGKEKRELNDTDQQEYKSKPQSPRKSIPSQWMSKTTGPQLKTAQRAKQHETRKKALHGDSPISSGAKMARGARSSMDIGRPHSIEMTTFLTKDAAAAMEGDITSESSLHAAKSLRRVPNKSSLKSPAGSPVRESPGRRSTIEINVSPTRHNFGYDGARQSKPTEKDKSSNIQSPVLSTGNTPYASASHSPVSSSARDSVESFVTAFESPEVQNPDYLDLTETDGDEQTRKTLGAMKPLQLVRSRGKSESHAKTVVSGGKTTSTRPFIPKSSLKTTDLSSISADHRSFEVVDSASSSGSATPATPAPPLQSSRIPRILAPVKHEQERSGISFSGPAMKRSKSFKSLALKTSTNLQYGTVKAPSSLKYGLARNAGDEGRTSSMFTEPRDVPLPETPATPLIRHVRTVNSLGATPILSRGSSVPVDIAVSQTATTYNNPKTTSVRTNTIHTENFPTQKLVGKYPMATSYLEERVQMDKPKMTCLEEDTVDECILLSNKATSESFSVPEYIDNAGKLQIFAGKQIPAIDAVNDVRHMTKETTVNAAAIADEVVQRDPAIISSRKKLDAFGMNLGIPIDASQLRVGAAHSIDSGTTQSDSFCDDSTIKSTCTQIGRPVENRFNIFPSQMTTQESRGNLEKLFVPSNLRATAPVFKPQQTSISVAGYRINPSEEENRLQESGLQYDPFTLSILYGIQMYHHMHPVPFDYNIGRQFSRSPRKGRGKKWNPNSNGRGLRPRECTEAPSPKRIQWSGNIQEAVGFAEPSNLAKDEFAGEEIQASADQIKVNTKASSTSSSLARGQEPIDKELSNECFEGLSRESTPFAVQMDNIIREGSRRNDGEDNGHISGPIDWSNIHNVPSHSQMSRLESPQAGRPFAPRLPNQFTNIHPRFGRNTPPYYPQYRGRQPYRHQNGGNGLYDNFSPAYQGRNHHAAAGVPMHATVPFPNPVPPSGRRTRVEGGTTKENVVFGVQDEKKDCGVIEIESAAEWGRGPTCNKCEPED